jgi:hypothetical protein
MRGRSETISELGRAPARQKRPSIQPSAPVPPPPPTAGAVRRWLRGALLDNLGLKFLSIVLAATVFLLVNDDKDREITVREGVLYVLPQDKGLVSERLNEVSVTLRGPWRRLRDFDERSLSRISLDLRTATTGEIAFTPEMVQTPPGLRVVSILIFLMSPSGRSQTTRYCDDRLSATFLSSDVSPLGAAAVSRMPPLYSVPAVNPASRLEDD